MLMANSGAFRAATDGPNRKKSGAASQRLDRQDVVLAVHEEREGLPLGEVLGHEAEDGFVGVEIQRQPKREGANRNTTSVIKAA